SAVARLRSATYLPAVSRLSVSSTEAGRAMNPEVSRDETAGKLAGYLQSRNVGRPRCRGFKRKLPPRERRELPVRWRCAGGGRRRLEATLGRSIDLDAFSSRTRN